MRFKVIFNGDKENYEVFEDRASAERFAAGFLNVQIVEVPETPADIQKQNKEKKQ